MGQRNEWINKGNAYSLYVLPDVMDRLPQVLMIRGTAAVAAAMMANLLDGEAEEREESLPTHFTSQYSVSRSLFLFQWSGVKGANALL